MTPKCTNLVGLAGFLASARLSLLTPTLVDRIPRERGDGEVWNIGGGYHLLVLPEGETACISGYRTKSRSEGEWLSLQVERIAKDAGLWLETSLGIDVGRECEGRVRDAGAVPATVAVLDGELRVGLTIA